jgi:hypothetical protein
MSKKTTISPAKPSAMSLADSAGEKIGPAEQAARRADAHQGRVAQRAYELYEQRGRQEGHSLEDWLNAERQLLGLAIQSLA